MKRQEVKIILVEPYFDLKTPEAIAPRDRRRRSWCCAPSVGGVKEVTDYIQLFDYDVNLLRRRHQADRGASSGMDSTILAVPRGAVRRQPDHRGHPRLSRRPRRRARRHLRRPVARADRRARRDDRDLCRSPAATRTRPRSTGSAWRSRSSAPPSSRSIQGQRCAHPAGSDHRHLLRGGVGGGHPGDEQVDAREAEHLKDMLVGNILRCSGPSRGRRPGSTRAIGVFHCVFRKRFLEISIEPRRRPTRRRVRAVLGLPLLRLVRLRRHASVAIAGVLLVFCYLIVPSVGAMLYAERIGPRLAIGWVMGMVVSVLGMYLSLDARPADRRDDRLHVRAAS